jgi:hypothetical protein
MAMPRAGHTVKTIDFLFVISHFDYPLKLLSPFFCYFGFSQLHSIIGIKSLYHLVTNTKPLHVYDHIQSGCSNHLGYMMF